MTGLADVDGFKIFMQVCVWLGFPPLAIVAVRFYSSFCAYFTHKNTVLPLFNFDYVPNWAVGGGGVGSLLLIQFLKKKRQWRTANWAEGRVYATPPKTSSVLIFQLFVVNSSSNAQNCAVEYHHTLYNKTRK